jgi:hypothetical protein
LESAWKVVEPSRELDDRFQYSTIRRIGLHVGDMLSELLIEGVNTGLDCV